MLKRNTAIKIITVIMVAQFVVSLSPTIPYSKFVGSGHIQRLGNLPKQNFQVILVGKFSVNNRDSIIEFTGTKLYSWGNISQSITDTTGKFALNLRTSWKVDSLAYRVFAVDKPTITSAFFGLPAPSETIYRNSSNTSTGCNSCVTENDTHAVIEGVHYNLPEQIVVIPY
ncbi:MAG: hypothetical protein WDA22_17520 [Bacteroidota bacterium]